MTFEEAYDARPKPLNQSISLDGMYLYFFEAGQRSSDSEINHPGNGTYDVRGSAPAVPAHLCGECSGRSEC